MSFEHFSALLLISALSAGLAAKGLILGMTGERDCAGSAKVGTPWLDYFLSVEGVAGTMKADPRYQRMRQ